MMSVQSVIMYENKEKRDDLLIAIEYLRSFNKGLRVWNEKIYYTAIQDLSHKFSEEICEEFISNFKCEFGDIYWEEYLDSHSDVCDYDSSVNHTTYRFDESDVEDWYIDKINTYNLYYVDDDFIEEYILDNLDKFEAIINGE
jgi:DNA-binding XRE family transcriptional regulator